MRETVKFYIIYIYLKKYNNKYKYNYVINAFRNKETKLQILHNLLKFN